MKRANTNACEARPAHLVALAGFIPRQGVEVKKQPYPLQPVVWDGKGVIRFQANPIVRFLLDWASNHGCDLNFLTMLSQQEGWDRRDWEHFAQLHGYSVSGWGGLSYVKDDTYALAQKALTALKKKHPKDPTRKRSDDTKDVTFYEARQHPQARRRSLLP